MDSTAATTADDITAAVMDHVADVEVPGLSDGWDGDGILFPTSFKLAHESGCELLWRQYNYIFHAVGILAIEYILI